MISYDICYNKKKHILIYFDILIGEYPISYHSFRFVTFMQRGKMYSMQLS